MTLTRLTPEDYITTRWSGGATTELLIRPRGAAYAQRAFLCRISSATVELDESTFTPLPDYDRLIATLEGEIDLIHDGGDSIHLRPYEVHAFDGGSDTRCQGRCRDFNLMLRKGRAKGSLLPLTVSGVFALSLSPERSLHGGGRPSRPRRRPAFGGRGRPGSVPPGRPPGPADAGGNNCLIDRIER